MTTRQDQKNYDEEGIVTWKKEYPDGLLAEFEERYSLDTGDIIEYALTFSDDEGCCLSLLEDPMEDIFFADTKSEIEIIGDEIAAKLQKAKAEGLAVRPFKAKGMKEKVISMNGGEISDYIESLLKQIKDEGREEDCLHAYLMGMLDRLYYDEKRFTKKDYEVGTKLIAMIPPTKWETENPESMDYASNSK